MTVTDYAQEISPTDQKKERKKLAKREAQLMLKIEEGKKEAQKAEQKVARAQQRLEEAHVALHNLEMQLQQVQDALGTIPGKKKNKKAAAEPEEQPTITSSAPILEELTDTPVTNTLEQEHAAIQAGSIARDEPAPEPVPLNDILQETTQEHTPETVSAVGNSHTEPENQVDTEEQPATQASVDQPQAQEEASEPSLSSSTEEAPTAQDQAESAAEPEKPEESTPNDQGDATEHQAPTSTTRRRRRSTRTE